MKRAVAFISVLVLATIARANFYIPHAKLAGETVSVVIASNSARVDGAYQFEEWQTRDKKIAYFPVYSADPDAARTLADCRLQFHVGDKDGMPLPCRPPRHYAAPPPGVYVHWYCMKLDDLVDVPNGPLPRRPPVFRVSYIQPLIGGRFYYLPVLPYLDAAEGQRAWRFQLHARAADHKIGVQSECDYETAGDAVTVYLRDDTPVVLE